MSGEAVLGVDPGVHETGWAVLRAAGPAHGDAPLLVASGVLRTLPGRPLPDRLRDIHAGLSRLLELHRPEAFAAEEMFFTTIAHTVRATLQARGVVLLAAAQAGLPVHEYNPRTVKSALAGDGLATKPQVQAAVQRALKLPAPLRPNDVADAAAIALCHLRAGRARRLRVLDAWGAGAR